MFISKAENERAKKVEECLVKIGLAETAARHFDIARIIRKINSNKLAIKNEFDVEQDIVIKRDRKKEWELYDRSLKIITSGGWAAYLMCIAAREYANDKDVSRLMKLPVVKALLNVLRKGYSDEITGKVYIKPDPERADRIFARINPLYAAYIQAVKDTRLPGMEGARAKFCLYQMNRLGAGCEKNMKNAYDYLLQAAEEGLPDANYTLAGMYQKGYIDFNIEKDPARTYEYIKRASLCFAPLNNNLLSVEGKKLASAGNPLAQFVCAYSEFSLRNIKFCTEVAKIAGRGQDGEMRRYYKALRKEKLYRDFKQIYKELISYEKILKTSSNLDEKKKTKEYLQSIFNEFKEKWKTFTKQEKAAIDEIRQRGGLL